MKKKYPAVCLLASLLNPLGQGKKVVFPEKVRGKIQVFKKRVRKNLHFLGESPGNFFQKVYINPVTKYGTARYV